MVLICKVCIGYLFIHISGTVITSSVPQKQNSSLIQVTWGIIAFMRTNLMIATLLFCTQLCTAQTPDSTTKGFLHFTAGVYKHHNFYNPL